MPPTADLNIYLQRISQFPAAKAAKGFLNLHFFLFINKYSPIRSKNQQKSTKLTKEDVAIK
jgi:hypothetical protein